MKLLVLVLFASALWAQAPLTFTPSDDTMTPDLVSGTSYTVEATTEVSLWDIVVFTHSGQQVARQVVATPSSKVLTADSDLSIRASTTWKFWSPTEDVVCFMTGEVPDPPPVHESDIVVAHCLLRLVLSDYYAAPALGENLYYVHALNRPAITPGATRTLAQGTDSREWGLINSSTFVGVIRPSTE